MNPTLLRASHTVAARFHSRTAIVSGAGGLIGKAIAMRLASEGAKVVITDISARKLALTREAIAAVCPDAEVIEHRGSVLTLSEVEDLCAVIGSQARVDALFNVVGGVRGTELYEPLLSMSEERWDAAFELNLKGIFHLVRAFGPALEENGGAIVNISSIAFSGDHNQPDYAAAKAGVASLTRSLAAEFAPAVRVNCIAPGLIAVDTAMYDPEFVEGYIDRSLMKRIGHPDEIAAAAAFLASDDASFITGAILPVSGGIWPSL